MMHCSPPQKGDVGTVTIILVASCHLDNTKGTIACATEPVDGELAKYF